MDTLIVALDDRAASERALPTARELARRFGARIVLLHVDRLYAGLRGGRFPVRADRDERRAHLERVAAELRSDGLEAELEVATASLSHPAAVIAAAARRHRAGAIVLATRGHAPMLGVLASSVTQRLLHEAPCPVLVVTPRTTRETFRSTGPRAVKTAA